MPVQSWLMKKISLQTHDDPNSERLNAITHGLGILLAAVGTVLLFLRSNVEFRYQAGAAVYTVSLLFLYTSSTLYHASTSPLWKRIFRIFDHTAIYFLIAGSYTALAMLVEEPVGSLVIGLVWGITAFGILFTIVFWGRLKPLHVVIYLAMGWLIVFFWGPFMRAMEGGLFSWILAGGIVYSSGTIVYALKKIPHYHAIWHLFVLGGSILQYIGIYLYVR